MRDFVCMCVFINYMSWGSLCLYGFKRSLTVILALFEGILVSYAQQCGRPPLKEDRIVGGVDATHGAWPWQVDIQVGSTKTAPASWILIHYQFLPIKLIDICDIVVTPPSLSWLSDSHWWSYLWRLHLNTKLGPISCSLFPQVRKLSPDKNHVRSQLSTELAASLMNSLWDVSVDILAKVTVLKPLRNLKSSIFLY